MLYGYVYLVRPSQVHTYTSYFYGRWQNNVVQNGLAHACRYRQIPPYCYNWFSQYQPIQPVTFATSYLMILFVITIRLLILLVILSSLGCSFGSLWLASLLIFGVVTQLPAMEHARLGRSIEDVLGAVPETRPRPENGKGRTCCQKFGFNAE